MITRQLLPRVNKLTPCYCFSAEAEQFVNKARYLEKLKSDQTFSNVLYEGGKYILFLKNEMVCLNNDDKLVLKGYKGLCNFIRNSYLKKSF